MDREIRTVLVVEGSASFLFYICMLLRRLEYRVETAGSAEEAILKLETVSVSIVLTETSLPKMSGVDLLKRLKASSRLKSIPVIMMTQANDAVLSDACKSYGCAAVVRKPVEPDELYPILQSVSESIPRTNIRINTRLKAIVGDDLSKGGVPAEYATALSEGGLFVTTSCTQPRDTVTQVRIFLPTREVVAKAIVLYTSTEPLKDPGMGLKFTAISDSDRAEIKRFIKEDILSDIEPKKI